MAAFWLFNSIARRRRSASDTFLENGLAALRGHLQGEGHVVRVIDWATEKDYAAGTPGWLARLNRAMTARLMEWKAANRTGPGFKLLFLVSLLTQGLMDRILARRMNRRLRSLAGEAAREKVKLFGIKVWYGEAFEWAERLCTYLHRESPQTVVIAGGHQPTLYEEEFLRRTSFDLAVVSQGELPMTKLCGLADELEREGSFTREEFVARALELAESGAIKNLMYRKGNAVQKTSRYPRMNGGVHLPAYPDLDQEKARMHVIIESLGCTWGKCNFCVHRHFYDGYEPRRIESILREIERMRAQGVGLFRFAGSDTPPDLGRAIGEAILDKGIRIEFGMGSRALQGIARPEVYRKAVEAYELLIRAGLRAVFMGGETGDAWVNEHVMNKGLTPDEIVGSVRALREAERRAKGHVDVTLAMIYPVPTLGRVTQEDVFEANVRFIREVGPDSVIVTPPGPFRNTRWNLEAERFGFGLGDQFIDRMIRYEYVLYKPPFLWKEIPITLDGRPFAQALELCGRMRQAVEDLGLPTDLSDEHFLMLRAAGYEGREGAREFRKVTALDIVSGDYSNLRAIVNRVNAYSRRLAAAEAKPRTGTRLPARRPEGRGELIRL